MNNSLSISATDKFKVTIIGYGDTKDTIKNNFVIKNARRGKSIVSKVFYYIFRGIYIVNILKREKLKPEILIYYGTHCRILIPLLVYCRQNKIKLIADVCEWPDYSHLLMGRFGLIALDMHIAITILIPKCDGIIAISRYLENYFKNRGKLVIRIPVTVDTYEMPQETKFNSPFESKNLNLIYAGIPGKKDQLINVISAIHQLNKENIPVILHLLGPDESALKKEYPPLNSSYVIFYGRLPHDQISFYLSNADFSILFRYKKRYAQAGFPTKFVESLSAGLPVIANYTSDLPLYLKDGINGFVVNNTSTDELKSLFRKISKMQRSEFEPMRKSAFETARKHFDYRVYINEASDFLTKILTYPENKYSG